MKYSYYCKRCGFSFMSDDKAEVKAAKKDHRVFMPTELGAPKQKGCRVQTLMVGGTALMVPAGRSKEFKDEMSLKLRVDAAHRKINRLIKRTLAKD